MLNNVPTGINSVIRNLVINHPNRFDAQIIRKTVTRVSDSESMGLPTLGGIGVISSEDESEIEFTPLGNAYALQCNGQFAPSLMMERMDANNGQNESYFLIEPEILLPNAGGFEIEKSDLMYLLIPYSETDTIKLAFEIIGVETVGNIPPYSKRYICNRRDDLHLV